MQARAKKQNDMYVETNKRDYWALQKRYEQAYASAVSSSIAAADTKPLEQLVDSIKNEEYEVNSFLDVVLLQAQDILKQCGYTTKLLRSNNKRKLKRNYTSLHKQLEQTNLQLHSVEKSIYAIDIQLEQYTQKLDEQHKDIELQKQQLQELAQEIADYKEITKNSLQPKQEMFLQQGELEYDLKFQILENAQDTSAVTFSLLQDFYTQKAQEHALHSVFLSNQFLLKALKDKVDIELQKASQDHPVLTVSKNKVTITSSYKLQDALLDKEERYRKSYAKKSSTIPKYKTMSSDIQKKRSSLSSLR